MEIKINGIIFKLNQINGMIGSYEQLINELKKLDFDTNSIYVDGKRLTKELKRKLVKTISIVSNQINKYDYSLSVYQFMRLYVIENALELRDYRKKIIDSLKIVGLNHYEDKMLSNLSTLEIKLVLLATGLLSNPNILVIDHILNGFDIKERKKIMNLFHRLTDKYKKTIIIGSKDPELVYRYTSNLVCFSNHKLLIQGDTTKIFEEDTLTLIKNGISIPQTILFTNLVREKKISLNYHKDIRDLIKDIYKKV